MTCRQLESEQASVKGYVDQVETESEFDGLSVLSFLLDFGIGNMIEKDNAIKSADERDYRLQEASFKKGCSTTPPKRIERLQPPGTSAAK